MLEGQERTERLKFTIQVGGELEPRCHELSVGSTLTIGRGSKSGIVVMLPGVSNVHVELRLQPPAEASTKPRLVIRDLSTNGTGCKREGSAVRKLEKGIDTPLADGSVVFLPFRIKALEGMTAEELCSVLLVEMGTRPRRRLDAIAELAAIAETLGLPPPSPLTTSATPALAAPAAIAAAAAAGGQGALDLLTATAERGAPAEAFGEVSQPSHRAKERGREAREQQEAKANHEAQATREARPQATQERLQGDRPRPATAETEPTTAQQPPPVENEVDKRQRERVEEARLRKEMKRALRQQREDSALSAAAAAAGMTLAAESDGSPAAAPEAPAASASPPPLAASAASPAATAAAAGATAPAAKRAKVDPQPTPAAPAAPAAAAPPARMANGGATRAENKEPAPAARARAEPAADDDEQAPWRRGRRRKVAAGAPEAEGALPRQAARHEGAIATALETSPLWDLGLKEILASKASLARKQALGQETLQPTPNPAEPEPPRPKQPPAMTPSFAPPMLPQGNIAPAQVGATLAGGLPLPPHREPFMPVGFAHLGAQGALPLLAGAELRPGSMPDVSQFLTPLPFASPAHSEAQPSAMAPPLLRGGAGQLPTASLPMHGFSSMMPYGAAGPQGMLPPGQGPHGQLPSVASAGTGPGLGPSVRAAGNYDSSFQSALRASLAAVLQDNPSALSGAGLPGGGSTSKAFGAPPAFAPVGPLAPAPALAWMRPPQMQLQQQQMPTMMHHAIPQAAMMMPVQATLGDSAPWTR